MLEDGGGILMHINVADYGTLTLLFQDLVPDRLFITFIPIDNA